MKPRKTKLAAGIITAVVMVLAIAITVSAYCNHLFEMTTVYNQYKTYVNGSYHNNNKYGRLRCTICNYQTDGTISTLEAHNITSGTNVFVGHFIDEELGNYDLYRYVGNCGGCHESCYYEAKVPCTGGAMCGQLSPYAIPDVPVVEN